jgi:PAS domain S-box-containing protein
VIVHDVERRITFVNRAAERLVGLSRAEIIGRDCWTVLKGGFCGSRCAFCDQCVPDFDLEQYPLVVTSHTGERRRVEMTVVPMRDDQGEIVGVLAYARDVTEVLELRHAMQRERSFQGLVGEHHLMQEVYQTIREVAPTDVPVLVSGESGTGKELVARAVHEESERAGKPFVAVNCAALPENLLESELFGHVRGAFTGAVRDKKGRFALADGGTLFLDEVGELPLSMQVKLLRVLESQRFEPVGAERPLTVDVRIISATNRNLRDQVAGGAFRQDLFFRLAVVPISLPPLRERRTDILALADHFLERFVAQRGEGAAPPALSERALGRLLDHGAHERPAVRHGEVPRGRHRCAAPAPGAGAFCRRGGAAWRRGGAAWRRSGASCRRGGAAWRRSGAACRYDPPGPLAGNLGSFPGGAEAQAHDRAGTGGPGRGRRQPLRGCPQAGRGPLHPLPPPAAGREPGTRRELSAGVRGFRRFR